MRCSGRGACSAGMALAAAVWLLAPATVHAASQPFTYFESFENAQENTSADPRDCNRNGVIDCGTDNDCSTVTACPTDCATVPHAGMSCDEWTLPLAADPNLQLINETRAANTVDFKPAGVSIFPSSRGSAAVVGPGSTEICPADQDNGATVGGVVPDRMDFHVHTVKTPDIDGTDTTHAGTMPKAFLGQNSLHWGRHIEILPTKQHQRHRNRQRVFGDTYCLQCINAFVLDRPGGMNLNNRSTAGQPLQLSFWHIAEFCDETCFVGFLPKTADEMGIVEVRSAQKGTDLFGTWERVETSLNPYDGVQDTAYFTPTYEPPDDTNPNPPAGVDPTVTMCSPLTSYIGIGSAKGTSTACADGDGNGFGDCGNATGDVSRGEAGVGVWGRTTVDLGRYAGKRIQVRFITTTLDGRDIFASYLETTSNPFNDPKWSTDDGWYIDDVRVSGLVD